MKELFMVNISNIQLDEFTYNSLLNFMSEEKRKRIERFRRYEDKLRSLFGEVLAKNELSKKLQCKIEDIEFEKNEYGKLKLKGKDNLYFNISHSGDYVIVGISDSEIGVDIEIYEDAKHEIIDLAKRYYTEEEYNWILSFDENYRIEAFYILWTLKESYIKFEGKGLSISLSSFSFTLNNKNIYLKKDNNIDNDISFKNYDIDNKYKMSICYTEKEQGNEISIKHITLEQLKDDLKIK